MISLDDAVTDHKEMGAALDVFADYEPKPGSNMLLKKQLLAQAVLECLNIDSKLGRRMLEHWRTKWLDVMVYPPISLKDFYAVFNGEALLQTGWKPYY